MADKIKAKPIIKYKTNIINKAHLIKKLLMKQNSGYIFNVYMCNKRYSTQIVSIYNDIKSYKKINNCIFLCDWPIIIKGKDDDKLIYSGLFHAQSLNACLKKINLSFTKSVTQ